jgi:uncharacterized protein
MSDNPRPRFRVPAGSSRFTSDSFVNFAAGLGYGAQNLTAGSTYGFAPLSRNHYKLEMMYRGSWLVRQIVDSVAEDMTRAGVMMETDIIPEDEATITEEFQTLQLWPHLQQTIKWGRLYGGALGVILIDGQSPEKPLLLDRVFKGMFKGIMVLDRWMVNPSLQDTVREMGPDFGLPRYYDVVSDAHSVPGMRVHHSRCIRFDGVDLPYWQKMSENMWGLSVLEPMWDRLIAFDSATNGAAQLMYKAHLRTLSVEKLRELIAGGGKAYQAFLEQVGLIRLMQSNEGMTILDASDKFEVHPYSFMGISDLLVQFGQQLSGAAQIPLVRLFGQSPAGMNATGESDIRNYYDMINSQQEAKLRRPLTILFEIIHRHLFGLPLPKGFSFVFRPLWQLAENEKATSSGTITTSVLAAYEQGVVGRKTALKELREQSKVTGVWTNITDEEIEAADDEPPDPMAQPGDPAGAGAPSGASEPAIPGQEENQGPNADLFDRPDVAASAQQAGAPTNSRYARVRALLAPSVQPRSKHDRIMALFGTAAKDGSKLNGKAQKIARLLSRDQNSMVEIHGLTCIIETDKGERRLGAGWKTAMPCAYGYISGTGSAEGGAEQMDCYIGEDTTADRVYVLHQHKLNGEFDEHKCMLQFPDEEAAVQCYLASFDETGPQRLGRVDTMDVRAFKNWLSRNWQYSLRQEHNPQPGQEP